MENLKVLTPKTFAELFGDDGGEQRGRFTETTALALFKSEEFPSFRIGRNWYATTENAIEWLKNSGNKRIDRKKVSE